MTTLVDSTREEAVEPPRPAGASPQRRLGRGWLLPVWGWFIILWLCSPIIVMIVFGFNDGTGRGVSTHWNGITLKWYRQLFDLGDLSDAVLNSVKIAAATTAIAVVLGTLMGVALGKYRFRGAGSVNLLLFAAIAAPEVVLGSALLTLFLALDVPRGLVTILIAHVMFSVSFVVVTVRARMVGLDPALEEAARDLGAGPIAAFFRVTLPNIMPGVLAGGLLAFALSIDDYIITSFNNGTTSTFPLYVFGSAQRNAGTVPPQVNVMGTLIFAFGVLVALIGAVASRKRA